MENNSEKQLFESAWNGNLEVFKEFLPLFKKNLPTLRNERHQSVLYCACRNGRVPIVVELLRMKCMTPEELSRPQGPGNSTPLHAAGWGDHPEIVALLLFAEADPNVKNAASRLPEDEAGARTLTLFVKFKAGDKAGNKAFLQEHIPVDYKKIAKNSKIAKRKSRPMPKLKKSTKSSSNSVSHSSSPPSLSTSTHVPKSLSVSKDKSNTISPTEWFSNITGINEAEFRKLDKHQIFKANEKGELELHHANRTKITNCGQLKILPVKHLLSEISSERTKKPLMIEIITREDNDAESIRFVDVAYYQATAGSLTGESDIVFQVASNFNGIEAICDDIYPDVPSFTEQYLYDRTQGPVASISAGGAAICRVHSAFYDLKKDTKEWNQTKERQLNMLQGLNEYFPTKNGYVVLTGNELPLPKTDEEKEELSKRFNVCYHENVQVTSGHRTAQTIDLVEKEKHIDQVFCAAINIHQGESGKFNKAVPDVDRSCQFILDVSYEGTYLSSIVNKKKQLFLTLIGGGAFGNSRKWIYSSILKAHLKYTQNADCTLEKVTLLLFRLSELEKLFLDDLEKFDVPHKLIVYSKSIPDVRKSFKV